MPNQYNSLYSHYLPKWWLNKSDVFMELKPKSFWPLILLSRGSLNLQPPLYRLRCMSHNSLYYYYYEETILGRHISISLYGGHLLHFTGGNSFRLNEIPVGSLILKILRKIRLWHFTLCSRKRKDTKRNFLVSSPRQIVVFPWDRFRPYTNLHPSFGNLKRR